MKGKLRSVVLFKKTIRCYRNWKGIRWIDTIISTIPSWRLHEQNIFQNLKAIQTQISTYVGKTYKLN